MGELVDAARAGNIGQVCVLIAAGANVNETGADYKTALIEAAERGHTDCVKTLIAAGADVNNPGGTMSRRTALMMAAEKGHSDCVKELIAGGASVKASYYDNTKCNDISVLRIAAENGSEECVTLLVAAGADVNARGYSGKTELMTAVKAGKADWVKLLISAGADVNAQDDYGNTVLEQAVPSVKGILREAGAKRKIDFFMVGAALVGTLGVIGIGAFVHWIFRPLPIWGAGLVGMLMAFSIAVCIVDDSGKGSRSRLCWILFGVAIAAAVYFCVPSIPIWADVLLGILAAPVLCLPTLLLPAPLPSGAKINEEQHEQKAILQPPDVGIAQVELDLFDLFSNKPSGFADGIRVMFDMTRDTVGGDIRLIDLHFENGIVLWNVRIVGERRITLPSAYKAFTIKTVGVATRERQQDNSPLRATVK